MFAVLQPQAWGPDGLRGRLFAWRRPAVAIREARAGGIPYALLLARCKKGRMDWGKIYRAAGREAGRLLLPFGVTPPPGCGITGYDGGLYRRLLLANAFFRCMASCTPRQLSVALVDWEGRYGSLALELLARAGTVRVVTGRPEVYEVYEAEARRLLGAGLVVTEEAGCLDSVAAVLAPEGLTGGRRREGGALVRPLNRLFFSGEADAAFGLTLDGGCIRLPAPYESRAPFGVSPLDFAAALYDSARPKDLARLLPAYLQKEGRRIPLRTAAAMMAEAVRRPGAGVGNG